MKITERSPSQNAAGRARSKVESAGDRVIDSPLMSARQHEVGRIILTILRRLATVVVLVMAFILSAALTIYVLFRSGDTRVPNLIGKPEAEAVRIAEGAGFRVRVQRRADSAPANTVVETSPGPNASVKKDTSLTIVVSSGPVETKRGPS